MAMVDKSIFEKTSAARPWAIAMKTLSNSVSPTGTVPNLKKPLKISTHVPKCEYPIARIDRKPRTTTSLKVITAFSEL